MAFLELKNIGKIYVSEGSVAVGVRGVNLSFEQGEFVAVTGESGSGKSTLLNVISGMDSYEEGEMLVEGEPTSHFSEADREEYREKYISFIFQDYNILESFTVLQNVELALMHIRDRAERRRRAVDLLERVGLGAFLKQKGSQLSGGQKQRTVIARALAKDSPIILADEPTGNLDSTSSREIIELLAEVSRDKLLIVVTHDFSEVEAYATRHVRIFDGSVGGDFRLKAASAAVPQSQSSGTQLTADQIYPTRREQARQRRAERAKDLKEDLSNGLTLGAAMFTARPRLSFFLCLLLIVAGLALFIVTSTASQAGDYFGGYTMFTYSRGRLIVTRQDGMVMTEEELNGLKQELGASEVLHYDWLLDGTTDGGTYLPNVSYEYITPRYVRQKMYGKIYGRYPEKADEVLLSLPLHYQAQLGTDPARLVPFKALGSYTGLPSFKITGLHYYVDNNLQPEVLFSEEGFELVSLIERVRSNLRLNMFLDVAGAPEGEQVLYRASLVVRPSFTLQKGQIAVYAPQTMKAFDQYREKLELGGPDLPVSFKTALRAVLSLSYSAYTPGASGPSSLQKTFGEAQITVLNTPEDTYSLDECVMISVEDMKELAQPAMEQSYRQASLYFKTDAAAQKAAQTLREKEYIAVPSDTSYQPSVFETIMSTMSGVSLLFTWLLTILFLAFFIHLCTSRGVESSRGEIGILRSMGIPMRTVHTAMYVRMYLALIPAILFVLGFAALMFLVPRFNGIFRYLYLWQYLLMFAGLAIIATRVTRKQLGRLFGESVKTSLKGGEDR